jgi:leucyl aminopeptidase
VKVSRTDNRILSSDADVGIVCLGSDCRLGPHAKAVDEAIGGAIQRLIDCQEITGKSLETTVILAPSGVSFTHLVIVGLGADAFDVGLAFRAASAAVRTVSRKKRAHIEFAWDGDWSLAAQEAAVAGAIVGGTGQDLYRQEKNRVPPVAVTWVGFSAAACESGTILGDSINLTRRLVNTPAHDMYPESFAAESLLAAAGTGVKIEIWDQKRLQEEKCGALLAVARGSSREPRMVIARYDGAAAGTAPLALVGKGVTFDSGGLSIKPSDGMKTMKCDMAGAATVLGSLQAIAKLKLGLNVIGLMGLVENMVGPDSYKLGDVVTARNGRTIEIHNTDAEGRLVLADALDVAVGLGAAKLIDLATLTGACVVALGLDVAGFMTNDQDWCDEVHRAADACGESVWQLPMFPEFGKQIISEVADIKNTGDGRWGGAITAAKLLEEFVGDVPWVHIDIAGPSFLDKQKSWMEAGGSGVMVRTLVEVARRLAK